MWKRILFALVGVALIGVAVWLYAHGRSQPAAEPPAESGPVSVAPEKTSSPWPTREATPGMVVTVAPGTNTDQLDEAVSVGTRWVLARYAIDTALPYPGFDVAAVESPVTGPAAEDLRFQAQDWRAPREADQRAYDEQQGQHYTRAVVVKQVYAADHAGARTLTFEYETVGRSDQLSQSAVDSARVQLVMAAEDGQWKISRIDEEPQSL